MKFPSLLLLASGLLVTLVGSGCTKEARIARRVAAADRYYAAGQFDEAELEYINVLRAQPSNPRAMTQLGVMFYNQGRLGRVLPFLLKGRDLVPDNLEIRRDLGLMYLAYGDNTEARNEALFILGKNPADQEAPILLAESSSSEKDAADARKRLAELPAGNAAKAPALVALATLELRNHNLKEAESLLKRAEAADPKSHAVFSAWGSYYVLQKDQTNAEIAYHKAADLSGPRSSKKIQYAHFKLLMSDVDGAEKYLDELIKEVPDYIPAFISRAEVATAKRNFTEAEPFITKALQRDALHPEGLFIDLQVKIGKNEYAKAVAAADSAIKLYPNSAKLHYAQGIAYVGLQDTGKAISALTEALKLFPKYSEAVLLLAELEIRRGEPNAAAVRLRQLVRDRPELIQGWLLLANAMRAQGDLDGTATVYRQLIQLAPANPDPYLLLGTVLVQQNKVAEARQMFEKAFELAPRYMPPLEELINLDVREKKFAQAKARIEPRIADKATNAVDQSKFYILLAKIELAAGQTPPAEVALLRAIQVQPESPIAYLLLAQLYVATKRVDEALVNLDKVVTKDPRNVQAFMLRGVLQEQKQDYKGAADSYEKLITVNARFAPALNNLAWLNSEYLNQVDKGLDAARKARELAPNDPRVADTLGWILFKKAQYAEALLLLQQTVAALPELPDVQYHFGMIQYMLGAETAARAALQRAVDSKETFSARANAQQRLALLAMNTSTLSAANVPALEKLVSENKDDPVALTRLAAAYANSGANEKAVRTYESALALSPNNAKATLELAKVHAATNQKTKAIEFAKKARKAAPDDPEVAYQLGRLALDTGDQAWSLSLLQEASRERNNDPQVQYDLGRAYYANGKLVEAEAAMRSVSARTPATTSTTEARQFLEFAGQGAAPSDTRIQQVLATSPNYVPALMAQASQRQRAGDTTAAVRGFEAVLAQYPDFTPAKRNLAILYAQNPVNDQKAFEFAVKARESYLEDPELAKAYGTVLYRRKDYPRAIATLEAALRGKPDDAETLYYLGLAQKSANRLAESKQSLQKAVALGLRPDLAADAAKALQNPK